jgi:hypothetical protein
MEKCGLRQVRLTLADKRSGSSRDLLFNDQLEVGGSNNLYCPHAQFNIVLT